MRYVYLLTFIIYCSESGAQDQLAQAGDSVRQRINASSSRTKAKYDSLVDVATWTKLRDSLRIQCWGDSLRRRIDRKLPISRIDRLRDSLRRIGTPEIKLNRYADSLVFKKESLMEETTAKQQQLQSRVTDRYRSWTQVVRKKLNLDSAGLKAPEPEMPVPINVPDQIGPNISSDSTIPSMESDVALPQFEVLSTDDFGSLGLSQDLGTVAGDLALPSMEQLELPENSMPELPDFQSEIARQKGEVARGAAEVKAITNDPGKAVEGAATELSEVKSATGQLQTGQEAVDAANRLKNANPTAAVNNFEGKEEVLASAMKAVAKLKQKYPSSAEMENMKQTKWPVNGLKGKPFHERFLAGLSLGVNRAGDTTNVDLFPNASYRITGRIEAGMGFQYRLRFNQADYSFDQANPVWGWNSFAVIKLIQGVYLRFEGDGTSYPTIRADQQVQRDWRWSFYSGVQTRFRLSNRIDGNVQMLYNFASSLKDGFPERLSIRIGIQYTKWR